MNFLLKIAVQLLRLIYLPFKCLPVKRKVSFISRQADSPSLDFQMLNREIQRQHPDYETVFLCRSLGGGLPAKLRYCFHMLRQMYHLATSQIVILDSYCIAASVLHHKKSLLIIQIWHSIGTMKKFGYSILDMPEGSSSKLAHVMNMHANYDYILAASDAYKSHLAEGFGYPLSQIVTLPLPRVEALESPAYREDAHRRIYARYPKLREKKTIVYVPTFRKGENESFRQAAAALADAVDYTRYNLVIKAHPLAQLQLSHKDAIVDKEFSSFDMLFISDYVISDFSCIIYEAAILKKPLYFYTYDYDHYLATRDIYIDYQEEMPGPICTSASDIIQAISQDSCNLKQVEAFLSKYVTPKSSRETKDIIDFIFEHQKG